METALLGGLSCPYGRDQRQGYTGGQAELAAGALQPSHPPTGLFAQPLCKSFHDPASRLGSSLCSIRLVKESHKATQT